MLRRSQVGLKTTMLAVAAAAANLAASSLLLKAPFLRSTTATLFIVGLLAVGVVLPALWVGAMRRLTHDSLLWHLVVVGLLVLLFIALAFSGRATAVLLTYLLAAAGAPSIMWYYVRGMEPSEQRDRAARLAMACTKGAAQLAFGFASWLLCFFLLRGIMA
jgi:hypothetical protein